MAPSLLPTALTSSVSQLASASASASASPPPASSASSTSKPPAYTRVDGLGLWRSWKRNFKNKLLALLDLIDNSLDAALVGAHPRPSPGPCLDDHDNRFVGRVHIYPDDMMPHDQVTAAIPSSASTSTSTVVTPEDVSCSSDLVVGSAPPPSVWPGTTQAKQRQIGPLPSGLCIVNNSKQSIRPMKQVLEIYNSSKVNSGASDIGENGVGLKQGCEFSLLWKLVYLVLFLCFMPYIPLSCLPQHNAKARR